MTGDAEPTAGAYEVRGGTVDGVYLVAKPGGPVVATFFAEENDPGWWRGAVRGRRRRLFIPAAGPLEVAERFMSR